MGLKDSILHAASVNLGYTKLLTNDLTEEQMTAQPIPGKVMNHPAWVIGHLARTAHFATGRLTGKEPTIPANWTELFGMKSVPTSDASKYPTKVELLKSLEDGIATFTAAFRVASDEQLATPMPEPMNKRFPTLGDFAVFLLTSHQSTHLGQLSAWRRASGLPSAM